jgi:hypothetical protein
LHTCQVNSRSLASMHGSSSAQVRWYRRLFTSYGSGRICRAYNIRKLAPSYAHEPVKRRTNIA